jgi:hypothetical protein
MSAAVELLTNEPVLLMMFSGDTDTKSVSDAYLRALELAQFASGAIYWLVDVRGASSPALIAAVLKEMVMGLAGAPVMPRMAFITQPGTQADPAWTASPTGWFTDYDTALHHAREHMAEAMHTH